MLQMMNLATIDQRTALLVLKDSSVLPVMKLMIALLDTFATLRQMLTLQQMRHLKMKEKPMPAHITTTVRKEPLSQPSVLLEPTLSLRLPSKKVSVQCVKWATIVIWKRMNHKIVHMEHTAHSLPKNQLCVQRVLTTHL